MRRRHVVATRITAAVVAMLVPLAIAIAGGIVALHGTTQRFDNATRKALTEHRPMNELRTALPDVTVSASYAAAGVGTVAAYEHLVAANEEAFRAMLARPDDGAAGFEAEHANLVVAFRRWHGLIEATGRLVRHEVPLTSTALSKLARQYQETGTALAKAEAIAWTEVRSQQQAAKRGERTTARYLEWLAVVAVALAGCIAFWLSRFFSRRLRTLRAGVQRIADGDLSSPIAVSGSDELAELGIAIDAMAHDLDAARSDLQHHALHDRLTGLPNRTLLLDRVEQAVHRVTRSNSVGALLLIGLDEFKVVNDAMGHRAGDALLATVASRLLEQLRDVDTASRIGGDEFAVLVENQVDDAAVFAVAERIRRAIGEPFDVDGAELRPRASIGIAIAREGNERAAELLRNADLAMTAAKQAGKDCCVTFEAPMHQDELERASLERDLRAAVHCNELALHYQPTIDLASGHITGVEALIRWYHPELGMISPVRFIPLAEETGLIVPIGQWVLHEACAQMCDWQRQDPGTYGAMKVNINISARQLERPGIVTDVAHALEQTGLAAKHVVLELTESILAGGDELIERLQALRALGVQLAVDDFGTGYSSLAYLRRFPIDVLKIDRTFISGIATQKTDATLAATIIELGRMLELTTVAEGIEDVDQLELLRSLGCTMGQGFLIARPLPADELAAFVAATTVYPVGSGDIAGAPRTAQMRVASPALLDAVADCLALIDDQGKLQYASAAAQRLLGYNPAEILGIDVFDLLHPDDVTEVADAWVTTVGTPGVKEPLALRLRRSDGSWLPVEIISNNMLAEPSIEGIVITIRDRSAVISTAT
jgi:diguanylate cyclase (GGDEF)-like protein/PAS domain S-box-containing protein